MESINKEHLPPLSDLIPQMGFPVYGLASPVYDLQLRTLHYGIEEAQGEVIGLMLCYLQAQVSPPQVFSVESSLLPNRVSPGDWEASIEWSWINLLHLRECVQRLHGSLPQEWVEDDELERKDQEDMARLQRLTWSALSPPRVPPVLAGLEVCRDAGGLILGRKFTQNHMLLLGCLGLAPEQFLKTLRQLVHLQDAPSAIDRHQVEFERLSQMD